jgi:serine/threonine protein kinase
MLGKTLGHYVILDKLGEGGMGAVYKARDTRLQRPVALKLLLPDRAGDPERRRRFLQEARAASALNHPHIVHIYETGGEDESEYIAMELVDGVILGRRIPPIGMPSVLVRGWKNRLVHARPAAFSGSVAHRTGHARREKDRCAGSFPRH